MCDLPSCLTNAFKFSEDGVTTIETTVATNGENTILQQIENNEDNENQLVDSLEEVIKDLSDLYYDISFNESIDYDHEYVSDYQDQYDLTTITDEIDITTIVNDGGDTLTTNSEDEVTLESETVVTDATLTDVTAVREAGLTNTTAMTTPDTTAITDATLTDTNIIPETTTAPSEFDSSVELDTLFLLQRSNNLTETDMSVLSALLELEKLRGAQQDMEAQIEDKVNQLELLLENNGTLVTDIPDIEDIRRPKFIGQKPRDGKTLDVVGKKKTIETSVNLFANLQAQLFSVLDARHKILQDVSEKINQELAVFQQTVDFLQRLVNFKLDQGRDKYSMRAIWG